MRFQPTAGLFNKLIFNKYIFEIFRYMYISHS